MNVVKKVGKALVLGLGLLLGAAIGVWLSLAASYWFLEPGQRASSAPLIAVAAALLVGLVLGVRRLFGSAGLVALSVAVILAAAASAWVLS